MKKLALALAVLVAAYLGLMNRAPPIRESADAPVIQARQTRQTTTKDASSSSLVAAIREQRSGTQVTGEGVVTKLLSDDNDGSRHQRFILTLPSGETLLFAHNIDLAPRIDALHVGDAVAFHGVYEWNPRGGVVHWTHHDPAGRHEAGWLRHSGQTYQ